LRWQSLRRFGDEFRANRTAALCVHEKHKAQTKGMNDYFNANGPALLAAMVDPTNIRTWWR
jgi:hypothetical protein